MFQNWEKKNVYSEMRILYYVCVSGQCSSNDKLLWFYGFFLYIH